MDSPALWERIRELEADVERLTHLLSLRTEDRDAWKHQAIECARMLAAANTAVAELREKS